MADGDDTDLTGATDRLAVALADVWRACERRLQVTVDGLACGANLPEQLSYALAVAARTVWTEAGLAGELLVQHRELAAELLVRHRPGSWEAVHVRDLVLPPDLLDFDPDLE